MVVTFHFHNLTLKQIFTENEQSAQTYGEKAVGIDFNPSGDFAVTNSKSVIADFINQMNDLRNATSDPEVKRMCSVAITEAQTAQMWAVKALTWK